MKMTKIAVGVALAAGTVAANAASLFFPYVIHNGSSVTTVVSVITGIVETNGQGVVTAGPRLRVKNAKALSPTVGQGALHWRYYSKDGDKAGENSGHCSEHDGDFNTSSGDIQTVDLGGVLSQADQYGVLFNDPSLNSRWNKLQPGETFTMASGMDKTRGFLLIEDGVMNKSNVLTERIAGGHAGALSGFAMVFDYGTGAAWGYRAIESEDVYQIANTGNGAVDAPTSLANLSDRFAFMPFDEVVTRFVITPVANDMLGGDAANTIYDATVNVTAEADMGSVAYNRDEVPKSGSVGYQVNCVGTVDMTQLMAPRLRKTIFKDGGWSRLKVSAAPHTPAENDVTPATHVVAYQLEFGGEGNYNSADGSTTKGTFNGNPATGTFNNAYRIM